MSEPHGRERDAELAAEFWHEYHRKSKNRPHICDVPVEKLKERHANVLKLKEKYNPLDVGSLLAAEYDNVWGSRSCSSHLAEVMDGDDYCDYYCGSSRYYRITQNPTSELIEEFKQAMIADMRGDK